MKEVDGARSQGTDSILGRENFPCHISGINATVAGLEECLASIARVHQCILHLSASATVVAKLGVWSWFAYESRNCWELTASFNTSTLGRLEWA